MTDSVSEKLETLESYRKDQRKKKNKGKKSWRESVPNNYDMTEANAPIDFARGILINNPASLIEMEKENPLDESTFRRKYPYRPQIAFIEKAKPIDQQVQWENVWHGDKKPNLVLEFREHNHNGVYQLKAVAGLYAFVIVPSFDPQRSVWERSCTGFVLIRGHKKKYFVTKGKDPKSVLLEIFRQDWLLHKGMWRSLYRKTDGNRSLYKKITIVLPDSKTVVNLPKEYETEMNFSHVSGRLFWQKPPVHKTPAPKFWLARNIQVEPDNASTNPDSMSHQTWRIRLVESGLNQGLSRGGTDYGLWYARKIVRRATQYSPEINELMD